MAMAVSATAGAWNRTGPVWTWLELEVERLVRLIELGAFEVRRIEVDDGYAPWHFLNFFPLPHQHGSLRPILSRSAVTRCCVATAPPPPSPVLTLIPSPAAAIASAPASDSCWYANPPPSTSSERTSSSA